SSVFLNCFQSILRTGGHIRTPCPLQRRQIFLIKTDHLNQYDFHPCLQYHFHCGTNNRTNPKTSLSSYSESFEAFPDEAAPSRSPGSSFPLRSLSLQQQYPARCEISAHLNGSFHESIASDDGGRHYYPPSYSRIFRFDFFPDDFPLHT